MILPISITDGKGHEVGEVVVVSRQCLKCGKDTTTTAGGQVVCFVFSGAAYVSYDQAIPQPTIYLHPKCAAELSEDIAVTLAAAEKWRPLVIDISGWSAGGIFALWMMGQLCLILALGLLFRIWVGEPGPQDDTSPIMRAIIDAASLEDIPGTVNAAQEEPPASQSLS